MSDKTLTKKSEIKKLAILNNARKVFLKKGFQPLRCKILLKLVVLVAVVFIYTLLLLMTFF